MKGLVAAAFLLALSVSFFEACDPGPGNGMVSSNVLNSSLLSSSSSASSEGRNTPPDCSKAVASPDTLWPPNHKLTDIAITGVTDPDGDSVTIDVTSIVSDEPVLANGSGHTEPDCTLAPPAVRAERTGGGDGRIYLVSFTATDSFGLTCTGTVTVCVPHDQGHGGGCVDSGARYSCTQ